MTRIPYSFLAVALLCSAPVLAQTPVVPPVVPGPVVMTPHTAMRACMMEHLPALKGEVQAHMQQFRASHPNATRVERRAERKVFGQQMRQAHAPEIQAAKAACRNAA